MPTLSSLIVANLLLLGLSPAVFCQTDRELDEWLDAQMRAAEAPMSVPGFHVLWTVEEHEVPPPQQLAALRRQVSTVPNHPASRLLQAYERRLNGRPDVNSFALWDNGAGSFRFNRTLAQDAPCAYFDIISTASDSWTMTDQQLALLKPGSHVPGRDYSGSEAEARRALGLMFRGGLDLIRTMELREVSRDQEGDGWELVATNSQTQASMRYRGHREDEISSYVVDSATLIAAPAFPGEVGEYWSFKQWRVVELVEGPVAGRVEEYRADGQLKRVLVFVEAAPFDRDEFNRVTETPEPTTLSDAVRGSVSFASVWDYLHDGGSLSQRDPESGVLSQGVVPPDTDASGRSLRYLGWLMVGLIALVLVWLRRRSNLNA